MIDKINCTRCSLEEKSWGVYFCGTIIVLSGSYRLVHLANVLASVVGLTSDQINAGQNFNALLLL